jgi:PII-like signaling protein
MIPGLCIRFFVQEDARYGHQRLHEWLFEQAQAEGIPGGSVFRATTGYGRHGLLEEGFFELAGKLPETVEFFAEAEKIRRLLDRVDQAGLKLVYAVHPVEFGVTGG